MRAICMAGGLYGNTAFDVGMGIVAAELEVLKGKVVDAFHLGIERHGGQGTRGATQLQLDLFEVVGIDVGIAQGVHEIAGLESRYLGHHQQQQGVGGNVEGYAQKDVGAALVELAAQSALGHIKLKKNVAGRQLHVVDLAYVPGTDQMSARVGVLPDPLHHLSNLVDVPPFVIGPAAPLVAVDGTEFAVRSEEHTSELQSRPHLVCRL